MNRFPEKSSKRCYSLWLTLLVLAVCYECALDDTWKSGQSADFTADICQEVQRDGISSMECLETLSDHTLLLQTSVKMAAKPSEAMNEQTLLFQTGYEKAGKPLRSGHAGVLTTDLVTMVSEASYVLEHAADGHQSAPVDGSEFVAGFAARVGVAMVALTLTVVFAWLLVNAAEAEDAEKIEAGSKPSLRATVWELLEARTPMGRKYQGFTIFLILATIVFFVLGTLLDRKYNIDPETGQYIGPAWSKFWDVLLFGSGDELAGASVFEILIVGIFSADYVLRLWAVVEDPAYNYSRMQYVFSFYSIVDLASIIPFYFEIATPVTELPASQFLRTLRLVRMLRVEGRYAEAFTLFDDVLVENTKLLITSTFVGFVVWVLWAGLYYVTERTNKAMIYCPACPDVDVQKCKIDEFGVASCSAAGCKSQCWNLFESIPSSMYFTLVNLFGEFPLSDRASPWGKVVATSLAVVAVFVFAIPTGIVGNGFDSLLKKKRAEREAPAEDAPPEEPPPEAPARGSDTFRGRVYDFIEGKTPAGVRFDWFIIGLIVLSSFTFFVETCQGFIDGNPTLFSFLEGFELFTVIVFTAEYATRAYAISGEDPRYLGWDGLLKWMGTFDSVVDLLSIVPYWLQIIFTKNMSNSTTFIRFLRLIRMFKTHTFQASFQVFADVLYAQADVLLITGFAAFVLWVLFSALLYLTERGNPDPEMASYYKTMPDSMWITLLDLSGECPLAMYTLPGKILTGIIGVIAVGFVAIPIGILGAGFQDWVEEHQEDTPDSPQHASVPVASPAGSAEDAAEGVSAKVGEEQDAQKQVRDFIEGDTPEGALFEKIILVLIFVTIVTAIIQTVPSLDCDTGAASMWCSFFAVVEAIAVLIFTIEYGLRFFAAESRLEYFFSFYSLIDLLAIVPWYIALLYPNGWVKDNDEIFRMFRILRLFKLDKFVPSLTLIDDVFRLKRNALFVTGVVAVIMWTLFGSLMYIAEHNDTTSGIDPIPLQGCSVNCTESDRYNNAFASMPFTMIHLTGDFPIIEYDWFGRIVCMVMVIIGVGIVSVPSGVIADGFVQVVSTKTRIGAEKRSALRAYDIALAELGDTPPPREFESPLLDSLQSDCNSFLNGQPRVKKAAQRTFFSKCFNKLIFALIILNAICVLIESLPSVSSKEFAFFGIFERFTVIIFTVEYLLRLFSVTKDKLHLYSRWEYVTTFFGIVDLLAILPWYVQLLIDPESQQTVAIFRMFRLFRLLELEHFITAFTVLDNVFYNSKGIFIATGLMALAIWITSSALFFLLESGNPNWCEEFSDPKCLVHYTSSCVCTSQTAFTSVPDTMYLTAIFLVGEWCVVDFTLPGKLLCLFLCLVGIAIYAVPVGTLFDSFGAVLEDGLGALDEEDDED